MGPKLVPRHPRADSGDRCCRLPARHPFANLLSSMGLSSKISPCSERIHLKTQMEEATRLLPLSIATRLVATESVDAIAVPTA